MKKPLAERIMLLSLSWLNDSLIKRLQLEVSSRYNEAELMLTAYYAQLRTLLPSANSFLPLAKGSSLLEKSPLENSQEGIF